MKKEELLKGGLQTLIGGGRQQNQTERLSDEASIIEEEVTFEDEDSTQEEENELIASVEDEQLREKLKQRQNSKRGRPRKGVVVRNKQEEIYTRFCALILKEQIAKLKEICYRETLTLKEVMGAIFEEAIKTYEKKNGKLHPQEHRGDASQIFKK